MSPPIPTFPPHWTKVRKDGKNNTLMGKLIQEDGIQADLIEDQEALASLLDKGLASKDEDGVVTLTSWGEKRMSFYVTTKNFLKKLTEKQ